MRLSDDVFKKYLNLTNDEWMEWSKKLIKYGYLSGNNLSIWKEGWLLFSKLNYEDKIKNKHMIEKLFELLNLNRRSISEDIFNLDFLIKKKEVLLKNRERLAKLKDNSSNSPVIQNILIEFKNVSNFINNRRIDDENPVSNNDERVIDVSHKVKKDNREIGSFKGGDLSVSSSSKSSVKKKRTKKSKNNIKKSSKKVAESGSSAKRVVSKIRLNSNRSYIDSIKSEKFASTREGAFKGLIKLARRSKRVVALTADLKGSFYLGQFEERFPERFFDFGISEQAMLAAAAGMSLNDKVPFVFSFAVFNPGRNWDQLRVSVAYQNSNVKIIGGHAGLETGKDGGTHQALEDLALTRVLPNLTVISPCDFDEAKKAVIEAAKIKGPVYIRLSRERFLRITNKNTEFVIGKGIVFDYGKDLTIISTGVMTPIVLKVRKLLFDNYHIKASVIHIHTVKPLDEKLILKYAKLTNLIVTVEDHQINGGLGSAICEYLSKAYPMKIVRIGVNDRFGESGAGKDLLKKFGLDEISIVEKILKHVKKS